MASAAVHPSGAPGGRERFIFAGLRVLHERGAAELTLRRVAAQAGSSTMGIYSCFGGRAGMLEAIYRRGFELLEDAITVPRAGTADQARGDLSQPIIAIATAYRRFALGNPALYGLMFERPLPGFDPPPPLRSWALNLTFSPLVAEVARAQAGGLLAGDDPVVPAVDHRPRHHQHRTHPRHAQPAAGLVRRQPGGRRADAAGGSASRADRTASPPVKRLLV
jgi:AcrR family transcriptional regulator